ncbi:MAG: hypothetical protein K0S45_1269, partial [Nitrospira sp.]|nr:hypothetical protein [Nitrospira sp.]
ALKVVLDVGEFAREVPYVMIVDEGNRRDRFLVPVPLLPDEIVSNQVSNGLRSIGIFTPLDQPIEIDEKVLIKGHTESDEVLHES